MKRYTTIHPLFMSFYSRSLYRDVGQNWKKLSFLYLFLLSAVCLIPIMYKIHYEVSDYLLKEAPKIVKQVPLITIAKGVASVDVEMPHVIRDPESGDPLIIIDTTGKTTSLKGTDIVLLLTKSTLVFKGRSSEARTLNLSEIGDLTIDQAQVYSWIEIFLEYFIYVLYPIALLFTFLFRIAQALIFAAIGISLAKTMGVSLRYGALVSLSIVAMTPSIILHTIYSYLDIDVPFRWLFNFAVAMGYLFFAVRANGDQGFPETGA